MPLIDIAENDKQLAREIRECCSSFDLERNGCELDRILRKVFVSLSMHETVEAIDNVECWRA